MTIDETTVLTSRTATMYIILFINERKMHFCIKQFRSEEVYCEASLLETLIISAQEVNERDDVLVVDAKEVLEELGISPSSKKKKILNRYELTFDSDNLNNLIDWLLYNYTDYADLKANFSDKDMLPLELRSKRKGL